MNKFYQDTAVVLLAYTYTNNIEYLFLMFFCHSPSLRGMSNQLNEGPHHEKERDEEPHHEKERDEEPHHEKDVLDDCIGS